MIWNVKLSEENTKCIEKLFNPVGEGLIKVSSCVLNSDTEIEERKNLSHETISNRSDSFSVF